MDEEFIETRLGDGIKALMARDWPELEAVNDDLDEELSELDGDEYSLLTSLIGGETARDLGLEQPVKEFELHLTRIEDTDLTVDTTFAENRLEELKPMLTG